MGIEDSSIIELIVDRLSECDISVIHSEEQDKIIYVSAYCNQLDDDISCEDIRIALISVGFEIFNETSSEDKESYTFNIPIDDTFIFLTVMTTTNSTNKVVVELRIQHEIINFCKLICEHTCNEVIFSGNPVTRYGMKVTSSDKYLQIIIDDTISVNDFIEQLKSYTHEKYIFEVRNVNRHTYLYVFLKIDRNVMFVCNLRYKSEFANIDNNIHDINGIKIYKPRIRLS